MHPLPDHFDASRPERSLDDRGHAVLPRLLEAAPCRDLFDDPTSPGRDRLGPRSVVLRGFAADATEGLLRAIEHVERDAPSRHMRTPGGFAMSVSTTNCGALGWITDRNGYRYGAIDPAHDRPWPDMPDAFARLARAAAAEAGFAGFEPDACLINRYLPGARMGLHQDRDERDFDAPIVSVSLGMTATFLFGGAGRGDRPLRTPLHHGDVAVWGGEDRLRFHGIAPLAGRPHPRLGRQRINLTFRKAG